MSEPGAKCNLDGFLDAVAARAPTPGGGAVAAAAGALATAMARMVAGYSAGKKVEAETAEVVTGLGAQLERADGMLRALLIEDAMAYETLTEAAKRLKDDPATGTEHEAALAVAMTVPMEVAATACEALNVMEHLLPLANRNLVSDLGVAAVLAEATARAASYMVHVNAHAFSDAEARQKAQHQIDQLLVRARETLTRIESELCDRS